MRAFMVGRSRMKLSSELHCTCEGEITMLYNGYTLKKAIGGKALKALFDSLDENSDFDYPFFSKTALSVGNPEYMLEEFIERGFLESAGIEKNAAGIERDSAGPERNAVGIEGNAAEEYPDSECCDSPRRFFIQLSADSISPHLYYFDGRMEYVHQSDSPMTSEVLSRVLKDSSERINERKRETVVLLSLGDVAPEPADLELLFQKIEEWRAGEENYRPLKLLILTTVKGFSALSALSATLRNCTVYISLASYCGSGSALLSKKEQLQRWKEAGAILGQHSGRFGALIPLLPLSSEDVEERSEAFEEFLRLASPEVIRLQLPYLTRKCSMEERSEAGRSLAGKAFKLFRRLCQQGIRETTIGSLMLSFSEETPRRRFCAADGCDQMSYFSDGETGICPLLRDSGADDRPFPVFSTLRCNRDCIAHALCQGGCAFAGLLAAGDCSAPGDYDAPDVFHCSLMKSLTGLMLLEWSSAVREGEPDSASHAALSFSSADPRQIKQLSGVTSELLFEELAGGASILDRRFHISPFVFLLRRRGYVALYHSLSLKKLFGDETLTSLYLQGRRGSKSPPCSLPLREYLETLSEGSEPSQAREDLAMLLDLEFIVPHESDARDLLRDARKNRIFSGHRIGLLYLLVSNECNLRCRYCSIECLDRKPLHFNYSQMSPSLAGKGIRLFLSLLDRKVLSPQVIYYGGEPLLNWSVLRGSLEEIREMEREGLFNGAAAECSIVCNGTLVTPDIAQQMKRLSLRASVSIDGLARHHDLYRRYRDGRGSWEDSLRGYRILKDHLGECGISCTLGPHNINDIEEIAEYFASRLECRGLGFNLIKGLPEGSDLDVSSRRVTEKIIKAYEIFRRYGVYEDRITRKIRAFVDEQPWIFDCAGYGGQMAICADGVIGPCHIAAEAHRFIWGHIDEDDIAERIEGSSLTREWCRRSPLLMEECSDCIGLGICGGGCADEAFVKGGSISALDRAFCEHCRHLIGWMCDDLARRMKDSGKFSGTAGRKVIYRHTS